MTRLIPLQDGYSAIVDDEDFERVSGHAWRVQRIGGRSPYAQRDKPRGRHGERGTVCLHVEILNCPVGTQVDHQDGNGLNCVRSNLRCATLAEQAQNRKFRRADGLKGIRLVHPEGSRPWQARIRGNKTDISLGCFATKEEAARAYDRAAVERYGNFARLNFPAK